MNNSLDMSFIASWNLSCNAIKRRVTSLKVQVQHCKLDGRRRSNSRRISVMTLWHRSSPSFDFMYMRITNLSSHILKCQENFNQRHLNHRESNNLNFLSFSLLQEKWKTCFRFFLFDKRLSSRYFCKLGWLCNKKKVTILGCKYIGFER